MSINGRFIPEFERHYGTIAMYPFRTDIWRDDAHFMQEYLIDLVNCISKYEKVYLVCRLEDVETLENISFQNVIIVPFEYDDIWARDISPTFIVENEKTKCVNWKFNSWGGIEEGSYYPWDKDDAFAKRFADYLHIDCIDADLILEGGAITTDGQGTLFTTKSVLLNKNRNPEKNIGEVENILKEKLHIHNIIWIDEGLKHDETNGHIDNILSVVRPHELCLAWTDDIGNPNYHIVRNCYKQITESYECIIHKIPLPPMQYMNIIESMGLKQNKDTLRRTEGDLLPASYLNYYLVNGAVILPSFGCPEDKTVYEQFKTIFPDRKIEQIYSREPLLGGGGIHCILHEIPEIRRPVCSRLSEKVEIRKSDINKKGMFAKSKIFQGEIVYVKGGHIITRDELYSSSTINSYLPISDEYYLGALSPEEEEDIKLYNNHSCDPNCGMSGDITFVAIRDIESGEELTIDYAFIDNEDYSFKCSCGSANCRHIITGYDWTIPELQEKYYKYFARYLQLKIDEQRKQIAGSMSRVED